VDPAVVVAADGVPVPVAVAALTTAICMRLTMERTAVSHASKSDGS